MSQTDVLGVQEFSDTAIGTEALDAAVKVAPIRVLSVRVINPGKLVVVFTGDVASVELALAAGRETAGAGLVDELFLPLVEQPVIGAISGRSAGNGGDAIGILETATIAAGIAAADIALKRADVRLAEIRLDDAMGGRASVRVTGSVGEVEAALEAAEEYTRSRGSLVRSVIIANPHDDLRALLTTGKEGDS